MWLKFRMRQSEDPEVGGSEFKDRVAESEAARSFLVPRGLGLGWASEVIVAYALQQIEEVAARIGLVS